MVQLRSGTALDAGITEVPKHERRNSDASTGSGNSSDIIEYDELEIVQEKRPKQYRTTRQKVDRRAPSTFWKKSFKEQTNGERLCNIATCPEDMHYLKDESTDRGPIRVLPAIGENIYILSRALAPLVIHWAFKQVYPDVKIPVKIAYPLYFAYFAGFAAMNVHRFNHLCLEYGTLDEKQIGRDRTPDKSVNNLAVGIIAYMLTRTAINFFLKYDEETTPLTDITIWAYPRYIAWIFAFDYFFYCYHRTTHEVDSLWFVHQHHHTTKHPTAILSILAEHYQEYLEVLLIPLAATLLVPMSFSEHWLTLCYTIYVEMAGHSGLRAYHMHPLMGWFLEPFGVGLIVEDHDLHHRFGKSGRNYGKQTRVYDAIFNTRAERIECYAWEKGTPGF